MKSAESTPIFLSGQSKITSTHQQHLAYIQYP